MRLAVVLVAAGLAAPAADDDLGSLLQGIGPAKRPAGDVVVTGWVERGRTDGRELVVRVEPHGAAKIVAEPGVTVTPVPRDGVVWPEDSAESDLAGQTYFAGPVELRLPFQAHDGKPVEAKVEYAYCLTGYQCLFGEAKVSAEAPNG